MTAVSLWFQSHQPFRIRNSSFFDLGKPPDFIDHDRNTYFLRQVLFNAYTPSLRLLQELLRTHGPRFRCGLSLTGTLLEQIQHRYPGAWRRMAPFLGHEAIELIPETWCHSLACFYSKTEFRAQVLKHRQTFIELSGRWQQVFRNTELAYRSDLARILPEMGYRAAIIEGHHRILGKRTPNALYVDATNPEFRLLPRNAHFSEKFSNYKAPRNTTCNRMAQELVDEIVATDDELITIGFDIENLGEHHHKLSGIFNFLRSFIRKALRSNRIRFLLPSEAITEVEPAGALEIFSPVTWHGRDHNISAWTGNIYQKEALRSLYSLEEKIIATGDEHLISTWRKLQSTDHLLYMNREEYINGKPAAYFSPFHGVDEAYLAFTNALNSLDVYAGQMLKEKGNTIFSSAPPPFGSEDKC